LRDLWRQTEEMERAGVSFDCAAARIALRAYAFRFPNTARVGYNRNGIRRHEAIDERDSSAK
jgi:hypothetical protein